MHLSVLSQRKTRVIFIKVCLCANLKQYPGLKSLHKNIDLCSLFRLDQLIISFYENVIKFILLHRNKFSLFLIGTLN